MTKSRCPSDRSQDVSKDLAYVRNFTCSLLRKLTELMEKTKDNSHEEALIATSVIYARIYGTEELFFDSYDKGRLLSEPEIRFGRIADSTERNLTMEVLSERWEKAKKKQES